MICVVHCVVHIVNKLICVHIVNKVLVCATCGVVVLANTSEATVDVQLNGVAIQAIYASQCDTCSTC